MSDVSRAEVARHGVWSSGVASTLFVLIPILRPLVSWFLWSVVRILDAAGSDEAGAAADTKPKKDGRVFGEASGTSRGSSAALGEC